MENNQLKDEILDEIQDVLSLDRIVKPSYDVDLFIRLIKFPVDEPDIKGIETRMLNALEKILIKPLDRLNKNSFFPEVAKFEPYLRKLIYLINPNKFREFQNTRDGLAALISFLNLNPNNINYTLNSVPVHKSANFSEHLLLTYNLRNIESHNCQNYSHYRLYRELRSVLIMCVFAVSKNREALKRILLKESYNDYLNTEINKVKNIKKIFIHIEGKETLANINLYAREILDTTILENQELEIEHEAREGTVEYLKETIAERKMIVLGEVGMGKTTSLLYLHLQDCEHCLINPDQKSVPVYIELKNLINNESIIDKIVKKIGVSEEFLVDELKKGKFNIYLDGLNEIEKNSKSNAFAQIRSMIADYPKNLFIISSRPQDYNGQFNSSTFGKSIPVFILQYMKDSQMKEYLQKNCPSKKEYIWTKINQNIRLKQIVNTPLMLTMLVSVVLKEGGIPDDKGKILRSFMVSLYDRETKQESLFNSEEFHLLLCYLGFHTRDLTGTNSGLDKHQYIIPILQEQKNNFGLDTNLIEFIKKALDLNIMVSDMDQLSFTHEIYQEYYAAEFLHNIKSGGK
ncbi:hypothetical protein [Fluviicola taffensis]|uniref:NACHT domain-containing protein n=1 Tax=Fluviicola taffensis TaxID=191579 RepID=UPI003137985A